MHLNSHSSTDFEEERKCLRISELHVIVQIVNNEISNWEIGLDQVSNTNIVHSDKNSL